MIVHEDAPFEHGDRLLLARPHAQRTYARVPLVLSPGVELSVSLFLTAYPTKPPLPRAVEARTNRPLRAVTSWLCKDTGQALRPHDIDLAMPFGSAGVLMVSQDDWRGVGALPSNPLGDSSASPTRTPVRPPASSSSSSSSSSSTGLRSPMESPLRVGGRSSVSDEPALVVISFHPASALRPWHHVRPPYLAFPSDSPVRGSIAAFAALLRQMRAKERIALARFVPRAGLQPRLVALVPQVAEDTEVGTRVPDALLVVDLPFLDDLRPVPLPLGSPAATPEAVSAASAVVQRITLRGFSPYNFRSPSLRKFFAVMEALALNDEAVRWSADDDDDVRPDTDAMQDRFGDLLRTFASHVTEDFKPAPPPKAPRARKRSKAAAAADDDDDDGDDDDDDDAGGAARRAPRPSARGRGRGRAAVDGDSDSDGPSRSSAKRSKPARAVVDDDSEGSEAAIDWASLAATGSLDERTVPELKDKLRAMGLAVGGKKSDLVARLSDALL